MIGRLVKVLEDDFKYSNKCFQLFYEFPNQTLYHLNSIVLEILLVTCPAIYANNSNHNQPSLSCLEYSETGLITPDGFGIKILEILLPNFSFNFVQKISQSERQNFSSSRLETRTWFEEVQSIALIVGSLPKGFDNIIHLKCLQILWNSPLISGTKYVPVSIMRELCGGMTGEYESRMDSIENRIIVFLQSLWNFGNISTNLKRFFKIYVFNNFGYTKKRSRKRNSSEESINLTSEEEEEKGEEEWQNVKQVWIMMVLWAPFVYQIVSDVKFFKDMMIYLIEGLDQVLEREKEKEEKREEEAREMEEEEMEERELEKGDDERYVEMVVDFINHGLTILRPVLRGKKEGEVAVMVNKAMVECLNTISPALRRFIIPY